MKTLRTLFLMALLFSLGGSLYAQTPVVQQWHTRNLGNGTGGVSSLRTYNTGTLYYKLFCSPTGTVTGANVKLEKSEDNSTWADLITTKDCTNAVNAVSIATQTNYVRINIETFAGTGSIYVGFMGFLTTPTSASGTVGIDQSVPGTTNGVVCISGCSGGTVATDDGTITGGQDTGIQISMGHVWNGSTWVRSLGNATDGLLVNLGTNNDVTVTSGTVTAVTSITNPVTVTDGSGALNTIVDSGTITAVTSITNPVTVTDGAGALNVIVDSGHVITDPTSVTNATLTAETTKIIGTVNIAAAQTIGLAAGTQVIGHVIVDSGGGGGTQYDQGTVSTIGQTGTAAIADVRATPALPSGVVDGDRITLSTNSVGGLWVAGSGAVVAQSVAIRCVNSNNNAFESCAGAGGITDTDDASIATGQSPSLNLTLTNFYNGTAWVRWSGATLADSVANPSIPYTAAFNMCWNGATWDRCLVSAGGAGTTDSNTTRVTIATDDAVNDAISELGLSVAAVGGAPPTRPQYTGVNVANVYRGWTAVNPAGSIFAGQVDIASINGTTADATGGKLNINTVSSITSALPAGDNNIGNVDIVSLPALPAGTNNIGDVDVLTVPADPFGANADGASTTGSISAKLRQIATNGIPAQSTPTAATTGGATPGSFLSNNSATEVIIKASAGQLYSLVVTNKLALPMYVRVYNLTDPDCTSATGIVNRYIVPAATDNSGGGFVHPIDIGEVLGTGISLCVTTTVSDTDNTAIGTGNAAVTYLFK